MKLSLTKSSWYWVNWMYRLKPCREYMEYMSHNGNNLYFFRNSEGDYLPCKSIQLDNNNEIIAII